MSAANCLLTEDQFLCSICLEVFVDPVTTPCGHNYCKTCITEHWNNNVTSQCPICKKGFLSRPELLVNTLISEMAAQFRQVSPRSAQLQLSESEQHVSKPGDVPCDICTGTKLKALKSCLVCLASYCQTHLQSHLTKPGLKTHDLMDPVENLEGRMCVKHNKLLELFCRTDQMCVCMLCNISDHKSHDVVPLKEEYRAKKAELEKTVAEGQEMIKKRHQNVKKIKRSVEVSEEDADRDREIAVGVQVFTTLIESVERCQKEFINAVKERQGKMVRRAEGLVAELEGEISELTNRISEREQISHSEDPLHLLQSLQTLSTAPPTKHWTEISIRPPSYEGTVVRAVAQLDQMLSEEMKKLYEAELKRVQQYAVDVTLDPDNSHPLSDLPSGRLKLNTIPYCRCVLPSNGFKSGRFYFVCVVEKWSTWALGVSYKPRISTRYLQIPLSPRNGHWAICYKRQGGYFAAADARVHLPLRSHLEKVGVFVDYEEGLVSFYDVNTAALIYSFTGCHFSQEIHPSLCLCMNADFEVHNVYLNCSIQ